jgi:hypothetical protein
MTEQTVKWTQSQKTAFEFVVRAVGEGLSGNEGLRQYRAGGGQIGRDLWFDLYRETFAQAGWRETIGQIPGTYTVREQFFGHTDLDWREKYVMQMKVSGIDPETNERITKWVCAESDKVLTKQEWQWLAQDAVSGKITTREFVIDSYLDYSGWTRD